MGVGLVGREERIGCGDGCASSCYREDLRHIVDVGLEAWRRCRITGIDTGDVGF